MPTFNSASLVGRTIDTIVSFAESQGWDYELVLVNDSPPDDTWEVVRSRAVKNPRILALCLMRNYGQHAAVLCGLRHSRGEYAITLDDDMQNPPEEMGRLVEAASRGDYDLIFGHYRVKRHPLYRRIGSRTVSWLNERIFGKPRDLAVTNFRVIRRDVVDRMCAHRTIFPYINGLALLYSVRRANVLVEHRERPDGKSSYGLRQIFRLVLVILFGYSGFPLRVVAIGGVALASTSFLIGLVSLIRGLVVSSAVPGWTSLVTLISFFNGFLFLLLSILGEYVVRLQQQITSPSACAVIERAAAVE